MKRKPLYIDRPDLLSEWDYEKNKDICSPDEVTAGSGKVVWWKCSICGFSYQKRIIDVVNGHGCRKCAYNKVSIENSKPSGKKNRDSLVVEDFPSIAKEWDAQKNAPLSTKDLTSWSEKKVWWICPKGHSYQATPGNRIHNESGCPYCSGKKVLAGFNDLETLFPDVAGMWNYDKNTMLPSEISPHSNNRNIWWKCSKGHEWKAPPNNLVNGASCPHCSSSLRTSLPEQAIVFYLKKVTTVDSRKKLFGWEVDAFLPDHKIAIEYDGIYYHSVQDVKEREARKNADLKQHGIILLRVKETLDHQEDKENTLFYDRSKQYKELDDVLKRLLVRINELAGTDYIIPFDFENNRVQILQAYKSHVKKNSIAYTHPELSEEWNYIRNGNMTPEMFSKGSGEKVWWSCAKGHEWQATIASRASGAGCPYCSGFKWKTGEGDLLTKFPEIASEWDYEKNNPLTPDKINPGSKKKVWWTCKKGHSYQATPNSRTSNGTGCPICAGRKPKSK